MRLAIPVWQGRISPVFDVARHLLVVDIEGGRVAGRLEHELTDDDTDRASALTTLGVDTLICCAISKTVEARLRSAAVTVLPYLCGPVDQVIDACVADDLQEDRFAAPGRKQVREARDRSARAPRHSPGAGPGRR